MLGHPAGADQRLEVDAFDRFGDHEGATVDLSHFQDAR
jgi:hypothetical protein